MNCRKCGKDGGLKAFGSLCTECLVERKSRQDKFFEEMMRGYAEADREINFKTQYTSHMFWEDVRQSYSSPPPPRKKPWPKPEIYWLPDYNGWRVKDPVTEGYVDVPVEAVEAVIGRGIEAGLRAREIYRAEIEQCAKRLLILLLFGCPPKLCEPKLEVKVKADQDFWRFAERYIYIRKGKEYIYDVTI